MNPETDTPTNINLVAGIVCAYVQNNSVPLSELNNLISSVHGALVGLVGAAAATTKDMFEKPSAAQIRKSITHEALISFEDGKPYKTLRRHLTLRGLSPEAYRVKWGLSRDYPMTAAAYSEKRSALAKSLGLGQHGASSRKGRSPQAEAAPSSEETKRPRASKKVDQQQPDQQAA